MTIIKQIDIDEIVKIQLLIKHRQVKKEEISQQWLLAELRKLPYLTKLDEPALVSTIVREKGLILGVDAIAILKHKHEARDTFDFLFKDIKLGGLLISHAEGVTFDNVDFSDCHVNHVFAPTTIIANEGKMSNFNKACFENCDLHDVLFKNVSLNQAYFSHTKLSATQFMYSDLANIEFESVEFSRMPRFIHSNLYHSHANTHWQDMKRLSRRYFHAALLGALLLSASILVFGLIMVDLIPIKAIGGFVGVGLFLTGAILGYIGASSSYTYQDTAKNYERFEHIVHSHSENKKSWEEWHSKVG